MLIEPEERQTGTMKLGAINHIALTVSDLKRSEKFYDALLGFMGYEHG